MGVHHHRQYVPYLLIHFPLSELTHGCVTRYYSFIWGRFCRWNSFLKGNLRTCDQEEDS